MLNNVLFAATGAPPVATSPHPHAVRVRSLLLTIQGYFQSDDRLIVVPDLQNDAVAFDLTFDEIRLPVLSLFVSRVGRHDDHRFTLQYLPASPTSIALYVFHTGRKTKARHDIAWAGTHWRPDSFSAFLDEHSHAEFVHSALQQAGLITQNFRHLKSVG